MKKNKKLRSRGSSSPLRERRRSQIPEKLCIDIETFSKADLPKTGVYRYAEDPSFEILLFGVSVDGGPVDVYDIKQGEKLPSLVLDALQDNTVTKWAFNAAFERVCLSRFLWDMDLLEKGTYLDPRGWRCDMVWAGYMGFPMSLKGAGEALGLEEQKMEEGKRLITYFCKPYRETSINGYTNRNLPHHAPEKWELFKQYNKRDVEVEMSIQEKFSHHPVPEQVWSEYWMDQIINDRGILIDLEMVRNAILLDSLSQEKNTEELRKLTSLRNPRSVLQLRPWFDRQGFHMDSLDKEAVSEAMKSAPPFLKRVLTLWQEISKSAVKKYQAMENAVCSDGRLRGMFRFYGANRSGRFCLAEGTMILTRDIEGNISEKPIEEVLESDLLFDGNKWVHHDGVIYSGEKDVITWDGITATEEHQVFISEDTKIQLGEAKKGDKPLWRGNTKYIV